VLGDVRLALHHLGVATADPARAAELYRSLGYDVTELLRDPLQNVDLSLARHPRHPALPCLEIVSPTGARGPVDGVLERAGEGVYHTCFETNDREAALAALTRAAGRVLLVSPPTPALLFGGRKVSFHRVPGLGLVELLDAEAA
jgi:methylmalonyl-CoA/ethylmalonyl-CoA epimerase